MLDFVNIQLLPKLKTLTGAASDKLTTLVRTTFEDANNYMKNGTLMRQVVNKINGINFNASDDRHMFGDMDAHVYKTMDYIKIPEGTKFTVGSSGLLGDRFVNVTMPSGQPKAYLPPNAYVSGARETGIDDLTREGGALVNDLRGTVQKIDTTVNRLNQDTLSSANMENLKSSMEHLNQASGALAETSKKLDGVIEKADSTMGSAKKAADDLDNTIADTRKLVRTATQGKGLLAALLTNQELANDLRALIGNLRAHGVLFYRDSAAKIETNPAEPAKPTRQTRGR